MIKYNISILFKIILILSSCHTLKANSQYDVFPDHWWKPVPENEMKGWEIPPQAAKRENGEVILSKRNELGQFSNLSEALFELDGQKYASVEGLWQGMKYPEDKVNGEKDPRSLQADVTWPYTRDQVYAMSGFEAKKAGDIANENMKKLGIKWISYQGRKIEYKTEQGKIEHYQIIFKACNEKIRQNSKLRDLLLQTKNLILLPDHKQFPNADPVYAYFNMYMQIRKQIQNDQQKK